MTSPVRTLIRFAAAIAFASPVLAEEAPAPYFRYETGDSGSGDIEVRVRRFRHPKTGREVTLAGMCHTADADFYRRINTLAEKYDVVLVECVKGIPPVTVLPLIYMATLGNRLCGAARLESQADHLVQTGARFRNADMKFSEMGGYSFSTGNMLALPVMIVVGELAYTGVSLAESFAMLTGNGADYARGARDIMGGMTAASDMSSDNDDGETRLLLHDRNAVLLRALDEELAKPDSKKIFIPWGAAHHSGLEPELIARGFAPVDEHWERCIAVKSMNTSPETDVGWRGQLPYLICIRNSPTTFEFAGPLSLVSVHNAPRVHESSTLWGLLHRVRREDETESSSLLAGLCWWHNAKTDGSERTSYALAGLLGSYRESEECGERLGWWGFLGSSKRRYDAAGVEKSSGWSLPFTFGEKPLLYGETTDAATGKTEHRFLLFFKIKSD